MLYCILLETYRRYRLVARTSGSHPGNRGSIPRSATGKRKTHFIWVFSFGYNCCRGIERVEVN